MLPSRLGLAAPARSGSAALAQVAASRLASHGLASKPDSHQGAAQEAQPAQQGEQPQPASAASSRAPQPRTSAQLEPHWLERWLPKARPWLEMQNRHWWVHGLLRGRVKEYPQLEGREALLQQVVDAEYERVLQAHAHRAVDARAETHLQVAALALATHRALLPFLRDEAQVLDCIREQAGARTSAVLAWGLRLTKWMQPDGFAALCARLRGLQADYGAGFGSQLHVGESDAWLTITSCFYRELFEAEGVPQLAAACCCSQDRVWLEGPHYSGVRAGLEESQAAGDPCCCFRVQKC